jgi:peptidoglycan/LPS O-acetylase OafA/YrhL
VIVTPAAEQLEPAPSPAVAPPPGNPRFPLFDSLRAVAVLFIMVFHVASITGVVNRAVLGDALTILGNQAPIVFFVISGFLLYRPFVAANAEGRAGPSTWRYARRRALRILPAYWTALTVLAIFPGIVGVFSGDWWRYYFFLQAYSSRTLGQGVPTAWSLCVEVAFYVSLPLWALLVRRLTQRPGAFDRDARFWRRWLGAELAPLAVLAAAGIAVQLAASRLLISNLFSTTALGECPWLALGMALAVASVASDRGELRSRLVDLPADHPGVCWLGSAACLAGLTAVLHPGGLYRVIASLHTVQPVSRTLGSIALTGAFAALLVAPAIFDRRRGVPARVLAWRPLVYLGIVSYGFFLYHLAIAELLGEGSDPAHFSATGLNLVSHVHHLVTPVLILLTLAVTTAVATLSYYLVELPFLRRKEG